MDDANSTNLTIIVVLMLFLIGISIYAFFHKITNSNNNTINENNSNEIIDKDTSIYNSEEYKSYNIGDSITLKDNSSWHVIKNSYNNEDSIVILSDNDIGKISTINIENYLEEDYYNKLQENLNASDYDISNIRLLDIDDIMKITNIENISIGTSIEKEGIEWLYNKSTLTNNKQNSIPILICASDDNNKARLCKGMDADIFPVRPVITINKNYIVN